MSVTEVLNAQETSIGLRLRIPAELHEQPILFSLVRGFNLHLNIVLQNCHKTLPYLQAESGSGKIAQSDWNMILYEEWQNRTDFFKFLWNISALKSNFGNL